MGRALPASQFIRRRGRDMQVCKTQYQIAVAEGRNKYVFIGTKPTPSRSARVERKSPSDV